VEKLRLDAKDVEIVSILQSNGRASWKEIASKVHLSIPAVRTRVKRLEELGVIKGYTAVVDPSKILDRVRVFLLLRLPPEKLTQTLENLSKSQEVREMHRVAGGHNLVAKLEVRNVEELEEWSAKFLPPTAMYEQFIITSTFKEEYGSHLEREDALRIRCDFCKALIVEKPIIEIINGGRYYFSSKDCVEAFKSRFEKRVKKVDSIEKLGKILTCFRKIFK